LSAALDFIEVFLGEVAGFLEGKNLKCGKICNYKIPTLLIQNIPVKSPQITAPTLPKRSNPSAMGRTFSDTPKTLDQHKTTQFVYSSRLTS
jgi:hypothetical protein